MDTFRVRTQDNMHANEHEESLYAPAVAEFEWVLTKQKPLDLTVDSQLCASTSGPSGLQGLLGL
jgi:hypothetical protein